MGTSTPLLVRTFRRTKQTVPVCTGYTNADQHSLAAFLAKDRSWDRNPNEELRIAEWGVISRILELILCRYLFPAIGLTPDS
jgi:hypothetical protein